MLWRKAACLFLLAAAPVCAFDGPASYTLDLPFSPGTATPTWLGQPQFPATTFATLNVPIQPPDATSVLLITVFFQEKPDGFLRVNWQGAQGAQVLSDNFYEGIGMNNQRSLLIPPDAMQGPGAITFQCGDSALGIQRIRFQWLQNQASLVSPEIQDTLVTPSLGATQPAQALNGQPPLADSPFWKRHLVIVPITTAPERIEQGVEFSVQIDDVPASGRLALKENGLPWGKRLAVWINQQRVGTITPQVPDLLDDGFLDDPSSPGVYIGWREGTMYVPVSSLKTGVNAIQFAAEDDPDPTPEATANPSPAVLLPLALKDVVLQLNYHAATSTTSAPAAPAAPAIPATPALPPDAATSTGPVSSSSTPPEADLSIPGAFSLTVPPSTNTP